MAGSTDGPGGIESTVRSYYRTIDEGAYDDLRGLLAPEFVQRRPDRTLEGREAFVQFMREERPNKGTRHELGDVLADGGDIAVRGRVTDSGTTLFEFADFFRIEGGRIVELVTYTR